MMKTAATQAKNQMYRRRYHNSIINKMAHPSLTYIFIFIAFIFVVEFAAADEQSLLSLITRLNSDVIELRNEVEVHYSNRCDTILGCTYANYDECLSELSSGQTCPSVEDLGYNIDECGSGKSCNGLFDFTQTTVRLPNGTVEGVGRVPKSPLVSFISSFHIMMKISCLNTSS